MSTCPFDEPGCDGQDHSICGSGEGAGQAIGADFIQHTLGEMAAEAEAALLESLAIHAPPVPDWFAPEMPPNRGGFIGHEFLLAEAQQRLFQWPWAYARGVLAARPGGAK